MGFSDLLIPSKIEWDQIPTDLTYRKLRSNTISYSVYFVGDPFRNGPIRWRFRPCDGFCWVIFLGDWDPMGSITIFHHHLGEYPGRWIYGYAMKSMNSSPIHRIPYPWQPTSFIMFQGLELITPYLQGLNILKPPFFIWLVGHIYRIRW